MGAKVFHITLLELGLQADSVVFKVAPLAPVHVKLAADASCECKIRNSTRIKLSGNERQRPICPTLRRKLKGVTKIP
jgi:hypothetical protein